ncbi:MAG: ABC transporter permease subunit [Kiloniellales bacterium]|nr:ABC transporter permease subunit [Kiloniellales bacterium]
MTVSLGQREESATGPIGPAPRLARRGPWLAILPLAALLVAFFVIPTFGLLQDSFLQDGAFTLEFYRHVLVRPVYLQAMTNTFVIAALVTLLSVVMAYPLAYLLATVPPAAARLLFLVVLLPFWTSALVRTTAWIILLQRKGILNTLLIDAGILEQPIAFVYNLSGVLIGMTHVLMPFVVLPLYAAFCGLDRSLVQAAEGLGAGAIATFRRVVLPLTAPGVIAGGVIVFMNAIGYYITPALMGGPGQTMIAQMISFNLLEQLDWGLAAALSITLLLITLLLFLLFQRFFSLDRLLSGGGAGRTGEPLAGAGGRRTPGGVLAAFAGLLAAGFLILPIVFVFPMSLGSSPFLSFPPDDYSFRWYVNFFEQSKWLRALSNSVQVAIIAVSLALVTGTLAAIGMSRVKLRGKAMLEAFFILPMIVPVIVLAVGLYYFLAPLGLISSTIGLAIGHAMLASPFVFVTVRAALKGFDPNQELAAIGLGASWFTMFRRVMLPVIAPGIAAGAVFAFIVSFDDVVLALFLTNIRTRTLPKLMFEGVAHEIDPTIIATSAMLILFTVALMSIHILLSRRS